ncbi:Gfo/Idh/MocA family protein [Agromyces sp. LHK192]|uniref:Gfo/Idh/MocA family protein n=1 Tax=Agromyces sp. LHK192 TaxID=2498704 RepID=UPI000FDAD20B|nr:Gfo/Idh/MocA family oxidoreductase [Agromyces sp. LHK192]
MSARTAHDGAKNGPVGVGVVGAGVISDQYLGNLTRFADLEVRFVADLDRDRAAAQASRFGVAASGSLDELLTDDGVELVVNLTVPSAHVEVGLLALEAGKHVFAEKPLALDPADGRRLLARADELALRVGSAPDTFLGPGLQAVQRLVDDGEIGTPLTAIAQFQGTGPEAWHPNPEFLFAPGAGPLFDMGPYYLTALVQVLGPVARVSAASSTSSAVRTIGSGPRAGTVFPVRVPTFHAALLEFRDGAVAQAAFSFQSPRRVQPVLEVSGTSGAIAMPDPNGFHGSAVLWRGTAEPVEFAAPPTTDTRGIGVVEFARALRAGATPRASGELAFHVLEVLAAISEAARGGAPVEITSAPQRPLALPDGWDPAEATLERQVRVGG